MAQKRMFSLSVVDTDQFLEMPLSSRLLYYELGMRADDDGFVSNWKKILSFTGLKEDDLRVLIAKKYIIPFESGVIVIRHWRMNNYLQKDRIKPTIYQDELSELGTDKNNVYNLYTECIHSIDKNSIDKNSIEYNTTTNNTIFDFLEENGFILTPIQYEVVSQWKDDELTRYAIKKAVLNNKFNINYIDKILYSYQNENITTVQQAQESDEDFNRKRNNYYKNKYEVKETRQEREKRILEEMCKDD